MTPFFMFTSVTR